MTNVTPEAAIEADRADFATRCDAALTKLFSQAQATEEVQFAVALWPESRGAQDAGWNAAVESSLAVKEYHELIEKTKDWRMKARLTLSLYAHLSEASGLYEVPKNMLRIATGESYNILPFQHLTAARSATAKIIAPNASKIMKDLIAHSVEAGHPEIKDLILDAFDFDLRNGYAHADYIVWSDGVRLAMRNGGPKRIVPFDDIVMRVNRALAFFLSIGEVRGRFITSCYPSKHLLGRFNMDETVYPCAITWNPENKTFSVSTR